MSVEGQCEQNGRRLPLKHIYNSSWSRSQGVTKLWENIGASQSSPIQCHRFPYRHIGSLLPSPHITFEELTNHYYDTIHANAWGVQYDSNVSCAWGGQRGQRGTEGGGGVAAGWKETLTGKRVEHLRNFECRPGNPQSLCVQEQNDDNPNMWSGGISPATFRHLTGHR